MLSMTHRHCRRCEMTDVGRLRREYLRKDESDRSTLPDARAEWHQAPEQGFTFHDHRLSSLYRRAEQTALRLIQREDAPASSFRKYSKPTHATGGTSKGRA